MPNLLSPSVLASFKGSSRARGLRHRVGAAKGHYVPGSLAGRASRRLFVISLPGLPANRQVQLRIPTTLPSSPEYEVGLGSPGQRFLLPQLPPLLAVGAGRIART